MREEFLTYLNQEKEKVLAEEQQLIADERKDEATFCRIASNIYDILATLYQTAGNLAKKDAISDETVVAAIFMEKTQKVTANWKKSYEVAKEHNDVAKILVEETKLQTVDKILAEYKRLTEV